MTAFDARDSRLVPTLINVMVAGMCNPSRLSRGRLYARQGAVMDVRVDAGTLHGAVQGSRSAPYRVTVRVKAARRADTLTALVPAARDVSFDCTCPDWESPCKHAVAVMSTFAERLGHEPELLLTWRGDASSTGALRATVGSRANRSGADASVTAANGPDPAAVAALQHALGGTTSSEPRQQRPPTPLDDFSLTALAPTTLAPPVGTWDDVWAAMLTDALTMFATIPLRR